MQINRFGRNLKIHYYFEKDVPKDANVYWISEKIEYSDQQGDLPRVDNIICCDPNWNLFNNSFIVNLLFTQTKPINFYRIITRYTIEECLYKTLFVYPDDENILTALDEESIDMSLRYGVYHFFFNEKFGKDDTVSDEIISFSKSEDYQPHELPNGPINIRSNSFWEELDRKSVV